MPKSDIRIVIDTPPNVHNGEMASAATVVQVSQLAMSSPFSGDFQIVDNGRLIVGENIDFGDRVSSANLACSATIPAASIRLRC